MFMLLTLLFMTSCMVLKVSAYPGALCNVTYQIPTGCGEVLARIEDQVRDNLEDEKSDNKYFR